MFEVFELLVTVIGPGRVVRDQFRTKKTHHGRAAGLVETGTKIKTSEVTPTDGAGTKCSPRRRGAERIESRATREGGPRTDADPRPDAELRPLCTRPGRAIGPMRTRLEVIKKSHGVLHHDGTCRWRRLGAFGSCSFSVARWIACKKSIR